MNNLGVRTTKALIKKTMTADSKTNYDTETNNSEFEKKKTGTAENRTSKMRQITCNSINRILN